ncbi:acyl-CoA thioesterase [Roseateles violae]|uniref:Thioesterase family protein n=1 Tax=Roseateles violae TaxID=3058042 RepID=A0ABT8DZA4_9BURK|nr:thioesterase family protein [Pelomonas sp. PFR6]MDN3922888.1 thioesterase family protein [Pelomonas sp. PFR6]
MQHPFDAAIALTPLPGDAGHRGATSPAYANMVGPFGGVTAATLLQAALVHPARLGEPIALTVNFAAALAEGGFEVIARPVRSNRSTQHWLIELSQGGETAATASAVFALRRETWSSAEAQMPAEVPSAASLAPARARFGAPAWVQRYDMRFVDGGMPEAFDGREQPASQSRLWLRDEPPRPLDFASLAAICDSFFPRIFLRRRQLAPIGTVTLTTYFHADAALLAAQGERPVLGCARGVNFRNGYFDQSAEVWSDAGQLLASTHQMVYFKG